MSGRPRSRNLAQQPVQGCLVRNGTYQNSLILFGERDRQVLEPPRPVLVNASLHTVLNALLSDSQR